VKALATSKRKARVDQFQAQVFEQAHSLAEKSNARLIGASERKKEREKERVNRARMHFQMVLERVEEMKERERVEAEEKRERCACRLKDAEKRRSGSWRERTANAAPDACKDHRLDVDDEEPEVVTSSNWQNAKLGSALKSKSVIRAASQPLSSASSGPSQSPSQSPSPSSTPSSAAVPPMQYEKAVEVFRASGIHGMPCEIDGIDEWTELTPVEGSLEQLHPLPMNHPRVTLPFDRFAERMADREVLLATRRILGALLPKKAKYNARVFLSAYMIVNYPEVVLSGGSGGVSYVSAGATQEARLTKAASHMIAEFDRRVFGGDRDHAGWSKGGAANISGNFLEAYVAYTDQFNMWKSHDAAGLENDLIKAAVELESSKLIKLNELSVRTNGVRHQVDIDALVEGVNHDLRLIEERVGSLTGTSGVARLKAALVAVKSSHETVKESEGSPLKTSPLRKMSRKESWGVDSVGSNESNEALKSSDREKGVKENKEINLSLMWNLLYDPRWRLPTGSLELQWDDALRQVSDDDVARRELLFDDQVQALDAERKQWKHLEASLLSEADGEPGTSSSSSAQNKVYTILKALGESLSKLKDIGGQLDEEYDRRCLQIQESLLPKAGSRFWMDVEAFVDAIDWCSGIVLQLCAPRRDSQIIRARALIGERFREALSDSDERKTVSAIVQSLRILQLQTRILSMDVANAHLEVLTSNLSRTSLPSRVEYARKKLAEELGFDQDNGPMDANCSSLNNTRGWIAVASGRLPRLEAALTSNHRCYHDGRGGLVSNHQHEQRDAKEPALNGFPIKMRTGIIDSAHVAMPVSSSRISSSPTGQQTLHLEPIQSLSCWRGLVRIGLVHLISGDGAIGSMSLPETLIRDLSRLFDLQSDFQKCTVLAICMTVIENAAKESSTGRAASHKKDAKARIQAILADPEVSLHHIALEVSSCIHAMHSNVEDYDMLRSHILGILKALMHRSSLEGRMLVEHLANMLVSMLIDGNKQYARSVCVKIGATEILDDLEDLASRIAAVAAVSEAVCGQWYADLSSEFTSKAA
jgi:hypothetical protein